MGSNIDKGILGERIAQEYLISNGYKIRERNYRTKIGEIDIVAEKLDTLVFIEVKTRTSTNYGFPYEAVDIRKQNKIVKSSLVYMKENGIRNCQVRYDIIEVFLFDPPKINHIENVFCI
ncbi:MAG: YraN family protein [Tissierellia bacterium]|nr:YraN family protein [Tissierellia bacterium]